MITLNDADFLVTSIATLPDHRHELRGTAPIKHALNPGDAVRACGKDWECVEVECRFERGASLMNFLLVRFE